MPNAQKNSGASYPAETPTAQWLLVSAICPLYTRGRNENITMSVLFTCSLKSKRVRKRRRILPPIARKRNLNSAKVPVTCTRMKGAAHNMYTTSGCEEHHLNQSLLTNLFCNQWYDGFFTNHSFQAMALIS